MNVRQEALALVNWLLEALTVKVLWRKQEQEVPAVLLAPPDRWTSMVGEGHGWQRLAQRVEQPYRMEFCLALQAMQSTDVPVPAEGKWVLKMPNGYGLFGGGDQAISCTTRLDKIADDQQLVENPVMDEFQRRRWESARKSL